MTNLATNLSRQAGAVYPPLACRVEGAGPNVVLVHGGAGSWTHWIRTIPALRDHFRVYAIDLPGCGDSPDFPAAGTDKQYFNWVAEAILAMCEGPIALVGFSFGGSVSAAVAPLLGDRLAALCLVAPGSFGKPTPRDVTMKPMRARDDREIDERENARHNLCQIMFANDESADEATVDLQIDNVRRARFPSRRISWQDRIDSDLAQIDCPIQFIWGLGDRMATPSVPARGERVRAAKPASRVDLIPGGGHWIQYESADAFNAVLLPFLTEFARS
ncbi:alpha/beta fold hydrolase [Sphingobium fuliginis]|uniref:2-hydroxy-6-oxo-6-phenylhexa-2,4-dienoate hydrolase n=1 Tax=Sphingobium fuliginis (strain ATCC 27551) TaxID=336203 RepID=A0A292ZBY8_SPHSA|nr:alpha/beta fold hydrolase [Sphingobium fuliginis]GAY22222.1 2-hydroxy-6-oxo-6-phenylhexa-2,4-dienoate hydrolase [Sphingobium fuliginis]